MSFDAKSIAREIVEGIGDIEDEEELDNFLTEHLVEDNGGGFLEKLRKYDKDSMFGMMNRITLCAYGHDYDFDKMVKGIVDMSKNGICKGNLVVKSFFDGLISELKKK